MWNFFGFKPDDDDVKGIIISKQCFCIVAALQGNAKILYNHLQRHHRIQYEFKGMGLFSTHLSLPFISKKVHNICKLM